MNARVLAFLAFLALAGGGIYYAVKHPGATGSGSTAGLDNLARQVPQTAQVFVALDLRDITSTQTLLFRLKKFLEESPEALKEWEATETRLGVKADELSRWTTPAGFLAVLPPAGQTSLVPPGSPPPAGQSELIACKSNLKNMATALEMYASDNAGRYPTAMATLTPDYLKTVPTCPAAKTDTYTASYQMAATPDNYTFECQGHHHPAEPENFPQYNSMEGMVAKSELSSPSPPPPAKPPGVVMGFPVTDVRLAQTDLQKILDAHMTTVKPEVKPVGGHNFTFYDGPGYGFVGTTLLVGSSAEALEQAVAAADGKSPNLTTLPTWVTARSKVKTETGLMAFWPLNPMLTDLTTLPDGPKVDDQTRAGLQALQFGIIAAWVKGDTLDLGGFLGVDPQSTSPFAKTLVTASNTTFLSSELSPAEWDSWSAYDVYYLYRVILAALELFPETRGQAKTYLGQGEMASGLSIEDDVFGGFTGEVGYTSNWMKQVNKLAHGEMGKARQGGQLTACKSNLKNIATACEMYSTDFAGLYPVSLEKLTPDYLRQIPTCPAAGSDTYSANFKSAAGPDNYTFMCSGEHHGKPADFPQYTAERGLIEGGQTEAAAGPADDSPSGLVVLPVKDQAKADKVMSKLDTYVHWEAGKKVGDVQLYTFAGVVKATRPGPKPVMLIAHGSEAEKIIEQALTTKAPVSAMAEYQKAGTDQPNRWITASFINLAPLKELLQEFLASANDPEMQSAVRMARKLLDNYSGGVSLTYIVAEPDGLRLTSAGKGSGEVAVATTAVAAAILVPNFVKARSQGQLTACKSNLKNIGTAMEMYSTDFSGLYPTSMDQLTPNYLRTIPTCPAAESVTYVGVTAAKPDLFTVICSGQHHGKVGLPADFPQYNAVEGLVERP